MFAILGGLGAATLWALATISSARAGRMIGSTSTLAWVMGIGLVATLPLAALSPLPAGLEPRHLVYALLGGVTNILGLFLAYRAVQIGKIGVATAVTSTEGAVAALVAVALGEPLAPVAGLLLAVIAAGVAVVALVPETDAAEAAVEGGAAAAEVHHERRLDPADARRAVLLAGLAALSFGIGLWNTGQLGRAVPLPWAVLPARVAGTLVVFLPLLLRGRLRITRAAFPYVTLMGLCEVFGTISYAFGARESVAIAAVLASQFAALSAIGAYLVFRERLTLRQGAGVVAIAVGVAILSAVRA